MTLANRLNFHREQEEVKLLNYEPIVKIVKKKKKKDNNTTFFSNVFSRRVKSQDKTISMKTRIFLSNKSSRR